MDNKPVVKIVYGCVSPLETLTARTEAVDSYEVHIISESGEYVLHPPKDVAPMKYYVRKLAEYYIDGGCNMSNMTIFCTGLIFNELLKTFTGEIHKIHISEVYEPLCKAFLGIE